MITKGKQQLKREAAHEKICLACIHCLASNGYAETSIQRVLKEAKVSKGALQHHFPTKQDLMAATAERILSNATFSPLITGTTNNQDRNVRSEIGQIWQKYVNTDEYRALLEILIAIRTDNALQHRLSDALKNWEKSRLTAAQSQYRTKSGDTQEVDILMTMTTSLMRGLIIQAQYNGDASFNQKIVNYWLEIIGERLVPANPAPSNINH